MKTIKNISQKPNIIAIDDSPMLANFLKRFLTKDYNVTIYSSTSDALKDLSEGTISPDCIITDYYLGNDLTGLEFTKQLKEIDPIIPILFLSGSCDMNQSLTL